MDTSALTPIEIQQVRELLSHEQQQPPQFPSPAAWVLYWRMYSRTKELATLGLVKKTRRYRGFMLELVGPMQKKTGGGGVCIGRSSL